MEPLAPSAHPDRMYEVICGRLPSSDGSDIKQYAWQTSASGLAAVWSRENTREALWDAMARKEVYATSGTRLKVRVFAGWDFAESMTWIDPILPNMAMMVGVPMGGDLNTAPDGKRRFMVRAVRDPDGADLDRVQIIKGWLDKDGGDPRKDL